MGVMNHLAILAEDCGIPESSLDAFVVYVELLGGFEHAEKAAQNFEEAYEGVWTSIDEFAHALISREFPDVMETLDEHGLVFGIDYDAWESDYWFDVDTGFVFGKDAVRL